MNRDIFKRDSFWQKRSYKLEISLFLVAIAIAIFFIVNYGDSDNQLTKITTTAIVDVEPEISDLEIGKEIKLGDASFIINKVDKEKSVRNYVASGFFYVITLTVSSDKPYIPEPRIISGRNEIAPNYEIEEKFGNVLRQIEGNATGIKIFDVPKDFKTVYLNLDISNKNSTLIKLK